MLFSVPRLLSHFRRRKELSIITISTVLLTSIMGNAVVFFIFDGDVNPEINFGDAVWYSVVSITTIGYGDFSAETLWSRIGTTIFIIIVGLTAFTSVVGIGVDWIIDFNQKERSGLGKIRAKNHVLIINFPSERRVRQIIEEYYQDLSHKNRDTIIVTDQIETLTFNMPRVHFIFGSPLEEDTLERADISSADQAIVLSTGYDDVNSDSIAASISSILEHLNPQINIVAECLNTKHELLFQNSKKVSLVFPLRIANNLIVQEIQDPGVNLLASAITSNQIEGTLSSTKVTDPPKNSLTYVSVAKTLLDHGVNLVGIIRNSRVHVNFNSLIISENDVMVSISLTRHSWENIKDMLADL